jgi:hypothetical protein
VKFYQGWIMDSSFNQELEKLLNLEMVDFPFRASFHDRCTHFKPILHQDKSSIWKFLQHESCSSCSKLSRDIKFAPFGLKLRKLCLVKVRHIFWTLRKISKSKNLQSLSRLLGQFSCTSRHYLKILSSQKLYLAMSSFTSFWNHLIWIHGLRDTFI